MIVSVEDPTWGYVGETENIKRRLAEHNAPSSKQVPSHLKPVVPVVLVTGFGFDGKNEANVKWRKRLETIWRNKNHGRGIPAQDSKEMLANLEQAIPELEREASSAPYNSLSLQVLQMANLTYTRKTM